MSSGQGSRGGKALSHSEVRLRQITDTIPAHVGYFDHDWVFRYGNKRYAQWFGTTSESMKDRSILEVIGRHVFDQVEDKVRRALAGEEVSYEYSMPGRGGETLYARSTLVPDFSPEGEVVGCYVHAVDITEQRRTQSALAQALRPGPQLARFEVNGEAFEVLSGGLREWYYPAIIARLLANKVIREAPRFDAAGNVSNMRELDGYGPFLAAAASKTATGEAAFPQTFGGGLGIERSLFALLQGPVIRTIDQVTYFGKNPDAGSPFLF